MIGDVSVILSSSLWWMVGGVGVTPFPGDCLQLCWQMVCWYMYIYRLIFSSIWPIWSDLFMIVRWGRGGGWEVSDCVDCLRRIPRQVSQVGTALDWAGPGPTALTSHRRISPPARPAWPCRLCPPCQSWWWWRRWWWWWWRCCWSLRHSVLPHWVCRAHWPGCLGSTDQYTPLQSTSGSRDPQPPLHWSGALKVVPGGGWWSAWYYSPTTSLPHHHQHRNTLGLITTNHREEQPGNTTRNIAHSNIINIILQSLGHGALGDRF